MGQYSLTRAALAAAICLGIAACEDPARPVPTISGAPLFVDSDPRGGTIFIDGADTGEETPAEIDQVRPGARAIVVELDTGSVTYSYAKFVVIDAELDNLVNGPLTLRCLRASCVRDAAAFHAPANIRFAVSAAGPPFLYDGHDAGIVWPTGTSNSYASIGMATVTALVEGNAVALGFANVGDTGNYWAGRPLPLTTPGDTYRVSVPAWITPPAGFAGTLRGLEVSHELTVDASLPDVVFLRVTWRNISADPLYRLLDTSSPAAGVIYTDAWLGFMLDADVGSFGEADDDLISYSVERALVFAYDSDFAVSGFSGGWSAQPGLIGLMLLEGPGASTRLNAWPRSRDFAAGANDTSGRALLTAEQTDPPNHADARIGYAPNDAASNHVLSVVSGPLTLVPGASASATFAVLLAPPAAGSYTSGTLHPAGDPLDPTRPLAAIAEDLLALADQLISGPPPQVP